MLRGLHVDVGELPHQPHGILIDLRLGFRSRRIAIEHVAGRLHGDVVPMLGRDNMREQSFLTAAVQNMKRLAKAFFLPFFFLPPAFLQTTTLRLSRKVAVC